MASGTTDGEGPDMSAPIDAEQAWKDLQRIRVPRERVYDEIERAAAGGWGTTWATAATMWVFLVGMGLDLPGWGMGLAVAAYVALLGALGVRQSRRSRVRLHRTRCTPRMLAAFVAGAVVTGGTVLLSGRLLDDALEPLPASLIQATVSAVVFVLFVGPTNRWATRSARRHGARTADPGTAGVGPAEGGAGR